MPIQTAADSISNSQGSPFGFKNRIINGAMVIDQRNAGASGTANNNYTLDRWEYFGSQASKGTWQQNAGSVTPPPGFTNYLGFTSSSAYTVGAAESFAFTQHIEGLNVADLAWGTANAKTVTLSFWVRSSLTGTFGGSINPTGNTRGYPYTYTINSANTWEYKTVTIPGDTTGTWGTDNGRGIALRFNLGAGATYSATGNAWTETDNIFNATGATSVVATNGATWYVTGVQLEKGSQATAFDYRPFTTELALAQRYYQQINGNSFVGTAAYGMIGSGIVYTSTQADISIPLKVSMRATPTISQSSTTIQVGGTLYTSTGIGDAGTTPNVIFVRISNAGTMTVGYGAELLSNNNTAGYFAASAEL